MAQNVERYARFRADPAKVRVALRKEGDFWCATVSSRPRLRIADKVHTASARSPQCAINDALHKASFAKLPGIDLDMDWAYTHPWFLASTSTHAGSQ